MKKLKLIFKILIVLTIVSCSSDDNNSNDDIIVEKRLTQIIFQNQSIQNIIYDNSGNVIEISDSNGLVISSNTYNTINKLIKHEFNEYDNGILLFKEIDNLTYNSDNKISNIEHISFFYNSDGSISNQNLTNNTITYSNNNITRTVEDFWNTRVEFGLINNLITSIKVYRTNELKSDMTFSYDSDGNCISGIGSIDEGSLDSTTDNIDLNVSYGIEEKNELFNMFFDYEILTLTSFNNLRQVLINQQGNKYPEIIQWYQYSDNTFKETNENSFDTEGYISSRILSEFPDYPNYGTINFTWE